jgi:hypothetical protein
VGFPLDKLSLPRLPAAAHLGPHFELLASQEPPLVPHHPHRHGQLGGVQVKDVGATGVVAEVLVVAVRQMISLK